MPKGYIVKLPMGMGKTRIVLAHLLRGVSYTLAGWNRRLKRTLILAPNDRVKRAWLRELVLLALYNDLIEDCEESVVREQGIRGLERLLRHNEILIPSFVTFRMLKRRRRKPFAEVHCHYLIIDEWHRLPMWFHNECREYVRYGESSKWFIGGNHIKKNVYFVSATPINPVLEQEYDIDENPYDDDLFKNRVSVAIANAINAIQAILGIRSIKKGDKFNDFISSIGLREITQYKRTRLNWSMPTEMQCKDNHTFSDKDIRHFELINLKQFLNNAIKSSNASNKIISKEYAYSVGLIRTRKKHRQGPHLVWCSKKGRMQCCFGEQYETLHYPDNLKKKSIKASVWLWEYHTRVKRLVNLLLDEHALKINKKGTVFLTNRKVLIFCTHRGIALGLVRVLQEILISDDLLGDGKVPVIDTNVNKTNDYIDSLITNFNKKNKHPSILVLTDALSESIDLHERCNLLVHFELPWSPLRLFQRIGRLTRLKTWGDRVVFNKKVRVGHIIIPGSVEEERVNRLIRRIEFLSYEKLWPKGYRNPRIVSGLIGNGPSLHYGEYKERF
jgi:superfamily II DNA or RNA helicase